MRIALISDIHGNLVALAAALADIERHGTDRIICLGDVAVFGPQPREVIGRLHDLDIPVIMGNTDQWLLDPKPWSTDEDEHRQVEIELWAAEQLNESDRTIIADYAPVLSFDFGDGFTLLCYHGSPSSFNHPVRSTTPEQELDDWFSQSRELVMAGGHTHEAMVRRYGAGILVNPGSVGLPIYRTADGHALNPTWAEYALVDYAAGSLSITLRQTPYQLEALQAAVRNSNMPHSDYWLSDWRRNGAGFIQELL